MQQLSVYGQEKVHETANLGQLNLFVNGLKGEIRNLDSSLSASAYTDEYADTPGKFDFVMANPPFNVDGVKLDDIGGHPLFARYGLPLSTAKSGKKQDTFSNANYLWIALFATALNETGRAGFVMANSASDAGKGELEIRRRLVEAGLVDVMITLSPNFFYTVTLPVTLWFFDRAKTDPAHPRHDQTLFIDARKIFSKVHGSNSLREFSQAQLLNLAAIVWLYRGENEKFWELRRLYETARETWQDDEVTNADTGRAYKGIEAHRDSLAQAFRVLANNTDAWRKAVKGAAPGLFDALEQEANDAIAAWQRRVEELKAVAAGHLTNKAAINELYKKAEEIVAFADKTLRPEKDKTFAKADIRGALKRLAQECDDALFVLERMAYFAAQTAWLDDNFPTGVWRDVEGLCRIASRADIARQQYSLNPGRYVGVAPEDDGLDEAGFRAFMQDNAAALATLHGQAGELQRLIAEDLQALFNETKAEAA
jgi:type I restriction enzyme M protein